MNDNLLANAKLAYTVIEAAQALGIGRTFLWRLISEGKIPTRRIGARVIIAAPDLQAFVAALPVEARQRGAGRSA